MNEPGNVFDVSTTLMEIDDLPESETEAEPTPVDVPPALRESEPHYFTPSATAKQADLRRRALAAVGLAAGGVVVIALGSAAVGFGHGPTNAAAPVAAPSGEPTIERYGQAGEPAPRSQARPSRSRTGRRRTGRGAGALTRGRIRIHGIATTQLQALPRRRNQNPPTPRNRNRRMSPNRNPHTSLLKKQRRPRRPRRPPHRREGRSSASSRDPDRSGHDDQHLSDVAALADAGRAPQRSLAVVLAADP